MVPSRLKREQFKRDMVDPAAKWQCIIIDRTRPLGINGLFGRWVRAGRQRDETTVYRDRLSKYSRFILVPCQNDIPFVLKDRKPARICTRRLKRNKTWLISLQIWSLFDLSLPFVSLRQGIYQL